MQYESCNNSSTLTCHVLKCQTKFISPEEDLAEKLNKFWELESSEQESSHDHLYKQFCTDIYFNQTECRYEVKLLFKEGHDLLSNNYSHCVQCLGSLKRKFTNKPELLNLYNDIIKTQISSGVIEHVPSDAELAPGQVHYLPHRPVIREDKSTTKVRMVFDASSKIEGPSLNECLYPGPSLTESLFGVLLRFRLYRYAFISDIEKAFLQISLAPEHREFARFLWFNDLRNANL